jgi:hypothetical protein
VSIETFQRIKESNEDCGCRECEDIGKIDIKMTKDINGGETSVSCSLCFLTDKTADVFLGIGESVEGREDAMRHLQKTPTNWKIEGARKP